MPILRYYTGNNIIGDRGWIPLNYNDKLPAASESLKIYRNIVPIIVPTREVSIGIFEYNPEKDFLFVIKNTVVLAEGINYTIDKRKKSIISKEKEWDNTSRFLFIVFSSIKKEPDVLGMHRFDLNIKSTQDNLKNIKINSFVDSKSPFYNPKTDVLDIYYKSTHLEEKKNYTIKEDGSIDLIDFALKKNEELAIYYWKNVRKDIDLVTEDSLPKFIITERKLKIALEEFNALSKSIMCGTGFFKSTDGALVVHNLNSNNYNVNITPYGNTQGTLGEYWTEQKTSNSFVVKNSGSNRSAKFDWTVVKYE